MSDDLVKRLRAEDPECGLRHSLAMEAADRIEQIKELYLEYVDLAEERAARIKQLEAALREIACDGEPYDKCHCVNSDECSYGIARAALGEKKDAS